LFKVILKNPGFCLGFLLGSGAIASRKESKILCGEKLVKDK
jgi:hypothetical protein